MIPIKFILNFFKSLKLLIEKNPLLFFVLFVTMFSIVTFSPIGTLYWIYAFTFYFLIKKEYKNLIIIWIFYFFFLHFSFTALFIEYNSSIWVGGDYTAELLNHITPLILDYPFLTNLCLETILLLHALSDYLGIHIYIPSYLYGICRFIQIIVEIASSGSGTV